MGHYSSEEEAALIYAEAFHMYRTSLAPLPHFWGEAEAPRSTFAIHIIGKNNTALESVVASTSKTDINSTPMATLDLSGTSNDLPLIFKDGSTTKLVVQPNKAARTLANAFRAEHRTLPIGRLMRKETHAMPHLNTWV